MADRQQSGVEAVRRLRGVSWRWREGVRGKRAGEREEGVIAQEVQAVLPELVGEGEDGYLTVDYRGIGEALAQALEELASGLRAEGKAPTAGSPAHTATVALFIERVKELDASLKSLSQRPGSGGESRS